MKKHLYGALTAVVLVSGCTASAHQSQQMPESVRLAHPENVAIRPPAFQRGIDILAYTSPKENVSAAAAAVVAYVKKLKANSLSISFPFFMRNRRSSTVFASPRTPTPAQIGLIVADARRAGLYVSVRPLLSEHQIGGNRTIWRPVHMSAWFASYRKFLLPYARKAQAKKAGMFIIGAEFSKFARSPLWNSLDRAVARVFHGRLAYSNNGPWNLTRWTGGRYTIKTVDAYPPMKPPLLRGWTAFDRTLPTRTIVTELGISAWDGAWLAPWQHRIQNQRFDPQVQARWFTAACKAAKATRLGGIYFWTLGLQVKFPTTTRTHPGAWAHSPGATAITRCFGAR